MHIVVLCGGLYPERNVSIATGRQIAAALMDIGHQVLLMDLFFGCSVKPARDAFDNNLERVPTVPMGQQPDLTDVQRQRAGNDANLIGDGVFELCRTADIVFMALHGEDGENGRLQAAFDLAGIKYTGTDFLGSALAMHKGISRTLMQAAGIKVPPGFILRRDELTPQITPPVVIKPASGGSSVATTIVRRESDILPALNAVFALDNEALVEQFVSGREFSVGVLGDAVLPVIEICPTAEFFDYEAKYQGHTTEVCPAEIPAEIAVKMQAHALAAHNALHLSVYSRTDFILSDDNEIFYLESNTLPGMTPLSLLPQEAQAIGLNFVDLCQKIIDISMEKYI
ncbi:MAG: D-alanine--D-alanine ligase [Oscillospiraceae bacterium]|nr:D-alanine--D-alanine ligase [Oscillospiraceae bacterium]